MPSSRRISAIAVRPVSSIVASASVVCGRSSPIARRSAPACRTMIERLWATTSWSSRAIRARSSATASLRVLLALVLELDRARGQRAGELLAAAHDRGRAPDRVQDAADEQDVADRRPRRSRSPCDHGDADHRGGDPSVAAARVGAARVCRHQQPRERRARRCRDVVRDVGDRDAREHDDEHDERGTPPPHQRHGRPQHEHDLHRPRRVDVAARRELDPAPRRPARAGCRCRSTGGATSSRPYTARPRCPRPFG